MTTIINKAKHEMNDESRAEGRPKLRNEYQAWLDDVSGRFGDPNNQIPVQPSRKQPMTKIRLFTRCRASIRLLVFMMAVGLIVLLGAALACSPASPASPGSGQTVTDVSASDQPPSDGIESVPVQQQSSGSKPTPLPTICADTVDAKGNPIKHCGPPPPVEGDDDDTKIDAELQSLVEDAQREQANRQEGQSEHVRPLRHRVWIQLTADTDGEAIIAWLEERGFSYEDQRRTGTIYAGVDLTAIPDLSEVEGVLQLLEPIKPNPA